MRRKTGLYSEIILTIVLVVGAALLFGGFLLLRLNERELLSQKVESSRQLVEFVAGAASMTTSAADPENVYSLVRRMMSHSGPELASWHIFDRDFSRVYGSGESAASFRQNLSMVREAGVFAQTILDVEYNQSWLPFFSSDSGFVRIAVPLANATDKYGVLLARYSLVTVQNQIVKARNLVFLYVLLYGSVLVAFGVIVLSRNVVRPVRRLQHATSQVAAGDLTASVTATGPGEISDLADSFNVMTEALQKGREELLRSERMASVGHLSAGMAHEIGNPLGAVVGYLELLKSELEPGRSREMVEHALAEISRIDRLVKDLLDYAAPKARGDEIIDPAEVLHAAIDMVGHQAAFENVSIVVDCPVHLPGVRIDPYKLTQVLVNLLLNARDSAEPDRPIRVTGESGDGSVKISVRDEGSGMTDDTLQNIFDPFFTTKQQGGGRGLGLTVCHRIVTEAGGKIDVVSRPDVGTTFTVSLPIERDDKS